MQQAVWEFDEEVQAPWRPLLRPVAAPVPASAPASATPLRPVTLRGPVSPRTDRAAGVVARGAARFPVRPARPPARQEAPPVRLTRRARRLTAVLLLAAGVALGSWLGPLMTGSGGDLRLAGVSSVVVEPGDTVWSIARSVAGDGDVRQVVARIRAANHLTSPDLQPGQVLRLP